MNQAEYRHTQLAITKLSEVICLLPLEETVALIRETQETQNILVTVEGRAALDKVESIAKAMLSVKVARTAARESQGEAMNQANEAAAKAYLDHLI